MSYSELLPEEACDSDTTGTLHPRQGGRGQSCNTTEVHGMYKYTGSSERYDMMQKSVAVTAIMCLMFLTLPWEWDPR